MQTITPLFTQVLMIQKANQRLVDSHVCLSMTHYQRSFDGSIPDFTAIDMEDYRNFDF